MNKWILPVLLVAALWAMPAARALGASAEDLSKIEGDKPLSAAGLKTVQDYVDDVAKQLAAAKDAKEVAKIREATLSAYKLNAGVYYQLEFARSYAAKIPAMLAMTDNAKLVAVAMLAADMPQASIAPGLEKLAASPNPGVRYWAVVAYKNCAKVMLAQGGDGAKSFLTTLETLGTKEPSGAILEGVFAALQPSGDMKRDQVTMLRAAMDKIWQARLGDLASGDLAMVEAYKTAVAGLEKIDDADMKPVDQMVADALNAASVALEKQENLSDTATGALMDLLSGAETKLAVNLKTPETSPVQKIFGDTKIKGAELGVEVRLAVNNTWAPLLAKNGIKFRAVPAPVATAVAPAPVTTKPVKPATTASAPAATVAPK
jgi:hypothetical protein